MADNDPALQYFKANMKNASFAKYDAGTDKVDTFRGIRGNDIFVLGEGDKVANNTKGYDAVVTENSFTIGRTGIDAVKLTGTKDSNIVGDKANNNLVGNAGKNAIDGGNGKDVISGGAGDDVLKGGNQNDIVLGGEGNDKVYGDQGNDLVDGGKGDDLVDGGIGNDKVLGGEGNDTVLGGAGNDTVVGGDGNDRLFGGDGNDSLEGGNEDDKLFGGAGNDKLFGGEGKDTLVGDVGANTMEGGNGDDVFVIEQQVGATDVITDFGKGHDVLDLSDTHASSMADLKIEQKGADVEITTPDGTKIKLLGITADKLAADSFVFGY